LIPFAGLAMGAGLGALFGHLGETGIDKIFQQRVRDYHEPASSALFMVIGHATPDRAIDALTQHGGTVITTSLSNEDTRALQEALQRAAPAEAASQLPPWTCAAAIDVLVMYGRIIHGGRGAAMEA
jgi:uncharacterized membrane protein